MHYKNIEEVIKTFHSVVDPPSIDADILMLRNHERINRLDESKEKYQGLQYYFFDDPLIHIST